MTNLDQANSLFAFSAKSSSAQPEQAAFFSPGVLWLTPNDLTIFQLNEILWRSRENHTFQVVMAPKIFNFSQLENQLAQELEMAVTDDLTRNFILANLAENLAQTLGLEYKNADGEINFNLLVALAKDLGDGFDRLKLASLSWNDLAALPPERLTGALAALGQQHDRLLSEQGLTDHFARRRELIARLSSGHDFQTLAGVETIVCRWSNRLSPFEADFLISLAARRKVEIVLHFPAWVLEENISHSAGFDNLRIIREIEKSPAPGLSLSFSEFDEKPSPPALAYASEFLLAPSSYKKTGPPEVDGCLRIIRTPTPYHEVEEAGRELKAILANGCPAHYLALAVPDIDAYSPLIEDVGRRFGLPFHFLKGESLATKGPALAVMDLLALGSSRWERSRVLRVLTSPYFITTGFDQAALYRAALSGGVTDERAGGGFEANLNKSRVLEAQRLRQEVVNLRKAFAKLEKAASWPEFIKIFKETLNALGWPGDLNHAPASPVNIQGADLSAAFMFKEELECLAEALNGPEAPPVGLPWFQVWLKYILDQRRVNYDANPEGRIWALSYYDLHGGHFDEIFMLGLNERIFPKAGPEGRWWPEELVESLSKTALGRSLWSGPAERYRQDEDVFAAGLGQAKKRIWLFHSTTGEGGRAALPSPLLAATMELWPSPEAPAPPMVEDRLWPNPPEAAQVRTEEELWATLLIKHPHNWEAELSGSPLASAFGHQMQFRRKQWQKLRLAAEPGPEAMAHWRSGLTAYQHHPVVLPALLVNLAQCPWFFWWKNMLDLESDGQPIEEWPRQTEGTLVHRVLERFLASRLGQIWPRRDITNADRAELAALIDEEAAKLAETEPLGREPLWDERRRRLKAQLLAWLERADQQPCPSAPQLLEWSFGKEDVPPLELFIDDQRRLYLKGRIDRLDDDGQGGLMAVDYKLRYRDSFKIKTTRQKETILPTTLYPLSVYSMAASGHFGRPAGGRLDFIDPADGDGNLTGFSTESPELSLNLETRRKLAEDGQFNLPNKLAKLWSMTERGFFEKSQEPVKELNCETCEFALICPQAGQTDEEEGVSA